MYPHWWTPWKSDDAAVSTDLGQIKGLGFNTLLLDHEVSQAMDNDWGWIDRDYKLAGQQKLSILPWLQLQGADRKALIKFWHANIKAAVNQGRQPEEDYVSFLDRDFQDAEVHYICAYLERYGNDPSLLKVSIHGKMHPVVGIMLETGWHNGDGFPLSFDPDTNAYFRKWMRSSYHDLAQLNKKWGTSYKTFDEIDPCDRAIFNYAFADKQNMPLAVREHVRIRAHAIDDALSYITRHVRDRYKDVVFAMESAYPLGSDNPDASVYQWNAAVESRDFQSADIVFVRTLGDTISGEVEKQQDDMRANGKLVVTAYRLLAGASDKKSVNFALDAALSGNGIAYYNWNEQADNACAIYDKPARQAQVESMNEMYTLLCNPEKRHDLDKPSVSQPGPAAPSVVAPAPVQVPPAQATPLPSPLPAPAAPAAPVSPTAPAVPVAPATPAVPAGN
jgi:hypothetical protein